MNVWWHLSDNSLLNEKYVKGNMKDLFFLDYLCVTLLKMKTITPLKLAGKFKLQLDQN
jgi:hypothetical protein